MLLAPEPEPVNSARRRDSPMDRKGAAIARAVSTYYRPGAWYQTTDSGPRLQVKRISATIIGQSMGSWCVAQQRSPSWNLDYAVGERVDPYPATHCPPADNPGKIDVELAPWDLQGGSTSHDPS